jgi:hypothetical protein
MFQAGGEPWDRWNPIVRDTIINLQRHDGCARGSWDHTSKWGGAGGRIYTTALAALTLETYYRYASHEEAEGALGGTVTAIEDLDSRPGPAELDARDESGAELQERMEKEPPERRVPKAKAGKAPGAKRRSRPRQGE